MNVLTFLYKLVYNIISSFLSYDLLQTLPKVQARNHDEKYQSENADNGWMVKG